MQTGGLNNKQINRQMGKQARKYTQQTNKQINKEKNRQTNGQTNKQTNGKTDRQMDRQINRQMDKQSDTLPNLSGSTNNNHRRIHSNRTHHNTQIESVKPHSKIVRRESSHTSVQLINSTEYTACSPSVSISKII